MMPFWDNGFGVSLRQLPSGGGAVPAAKKAVWVDNDFAIYPNGATSDTDNFQLLAVAALYSDLVDFKGFSCVFPGGLQKGRVQSFFNMEYRASLPYLSAARSGHMAADALIGRVYQGARTAAPSAGYSTATEASAALIAAARAQTADNPLHICMGGPFDNLAQAIYDAPDIVDKIAIYAVAFISTFFNATASINAFNYLNGLCSTSGLLKDTPFIAVNHTLYGMSPGAINAARDDAFVTNSIVGKGAIGKILADQCNVPQATSGVPTGFRCGDLPALMYVLDNLVRKNLADPTVAGGWGGRYEAVPSKGNKYYSDVQSGETVNAHPGANTVLQYRTDILADIAARLATCGPTPTAAAPTNARGDFDPNDDTTASVPTGTWLNKIAGMGDLIYSGAGGLITRVTGNLASKKVFRVARNVTSTANMAKYLSDGPNNELSKLFQGTSNPFVMAFIFRPTDTNSGILWSASRTVDAADYESVAYVSRNAASSQVRQPVGVGAPKTDGDGSGVTNVSGNDFVLVWRFDGYAMKHWRTAKTPIWYSSALATMTANIVFRLLCNSNIGASDPTYTLASRAMDIYRVKLWADAPDDTSMEQLVADLCTEYGLTVGA